LALVVDGDIVTVDADSGTLSIDVAPHEFAARTPTGRPPSADEWVGTGRELFASMRSAVGPADEGATVFRSAS
jgi:phosphogluconate dehydratase